MERRADLLVTLLLLGGALTAALAKKLPPGIKACPRNDPDFKACALKNARTAIPYIAKGIPSYGLLPLDPLHLQRIVVDDTGTTRQMAIATDMKDVDIVGLRNVQLHNIDMGYDVRQVLWEGVVPQLSLLGKYDVKGRVLILPIVGKGDMNITLDNVRFKYTFRVVDAGKRDGKSYIGASEPRLDFETSRCYVQLDNLFNGDKLLSDNMNVILNDNWRELVKDLGPPIAEALSSAFHQLVSNILRQVPLDDFFPETPVEP